MQFILGLSFILFSACGKQSFPNYDVYVDAPQFEEERAKYSAKFQNLNHSRVQAESEVWIQGNQFYVKVNLKNSAPLVKYRQYIHIGGNCPTSRDDLNGDGEIDFFEVLKVSGDLLVPLDKNLESQGLGDDWFPIAGTEGKYFYSSATWFNRFMIDLTSPDENPSDNLAKLSAGESFFPDERVIILYRETSDSYHPVTCGKYYSNSSAGRSSLPIPQLADSPSGN